MTVRNFLKMLGFFALIVSVPSFAHADEIMNGTNQVIAVSNPNDNNQNVIDQQNAVQDINNHSGQTLVVTQNNISDFTDANGNITITSPGDIVIGNGVNINTPGSITIGGGNVALNQGSQDGSGVSTTVTSSNPTVTLTGTFSIVPQTLVITQDNISDFTDANGNVTIISPGDIVIGDGVNIDTPGSVTIGSGNGSSFSGNAGNTGSSISISASSNVSLVSEGTLTVQAAEIPVVSVKEKKDEFFQHMMQSYRDALAKKSLEDQNASDTDDLLKKLHRKIQ